MRRYANRNRDMMGYTNEQPIPVKPSSSALDPKDERLVEMAEEIGWQKGQNDLLAEDNGRLEDDNRQLRDRNKELQEENIEFKRQEAAASAGYKSGFELVSEIEEAVKKMKANK